MNILDMYPSPIISRAMGVRTYDELEVPLESPCRCKQCGLPIERGIPQRKSIKPAFTAIDQFASPNSQYVCKWCDSIRRPRELSAVQGIMPKPEDRVQAEKVAEQNRKTFGVIYYGGPSPFMRRVHSENLMEALRIPSPDGLPFVFLIRVHHTVAQSTNRHCAWSAPVNFSNERYRVFVPWTIVEVDVPLLEEVMGILRGMEKEKWILYDKMHRSMMRGIASGDREEQLPILRRLGEYPVELVLLAARAIECLSYNEAKEKGEKK